MQNGRFLCKIALRLKKVCYNVSLYENCQRQSCNAFIGLTMQKRLVGDVSFHLKNWRILTHTPLQNAYFQSIFARSASAVTPSNKVKLTLIESPLHDFQ